VFYGFVSGFSIDCMAIGGILAFFLYKKKKIINFLYSQNIQYISYAVLFFLIGFGVKIPYVHYEFYGVFFGIVILNLASNKDSILNLEYKLLNY
tara:strand:- start:98734 stop:99015 length:282 start_codon:yes stop_codon:yes gene_type:complete